MEKLTALWNAYAVPIVLGAVSLLLFMFSLTLLITSSQPTTPIEFHSDASEATASGAMSQVMVDVEGAVVRSGVYQLPSGARVEDAIAAAGGFTKDVDSVALAKTINRAAKVVDGGKIYIPVLSSSPLSTLGDVSNLVSVNSGSQSNLESLPGVGPVTATKIIDNRPYQTLEELVSKKAMSQSLFDKLKDQLSL